MDFANDNPAKARLDDIRTRLKNGGISNWQQEANWIFREANDQGISECELQNWIKRRIDGEPLQYILGNTEFYNLTLFVGPGALIPRPETEILVENAVGLLRGLPCPKICDICTGTGAIALAIAKEIPAAAVVASDISPNALRWAHKNLEEAGLSNVNILQGDTFDSVAGLAPFDMITANPPYVTENEYSDLEPVVKDYEPELALVSGQDGLDLIRRIVSEAPRLLAPNGWILMEIGCGQGSALQSLLKENGFCDIEIIKDYSGLDRIAKAHL